MSREIQSDKIVFPNLNGIRFIAASMVLIHHVEFALLEIKLPSVWTYSGLGLIGNLGVSLFFTLSGFLITYILLSEKSKTGTISIRKFYIRRMLRIWPLYYLIIVLGLFVLPHIPFMHLPGTENIYLAFIKKLVLFVFILPNAAYIIWYHIPYLLHTWSIGVEEQYYLLWPWIVKRKKKILLVPVISYLFFTGLSIWSYYYDKRWVGMVNFGCISMGSIGGILLFNKVNWFIRLVHSHIVFLVACTGALILLFLPFGILQRQELFSVFFMIIIVYLASAPNTIVSLNNKLLNYLGKISYGIYMYQLIAIYFVVKLFQKSGWEETTGIKIAIHILSFILTILIAYVSYEFYEKRFLKKKKKFEVVESGS